ncbi:hypothetical protein [Tychonema sp. BBK16]|uniref:hypothetical protein n=1 Tax=Tychonema sp. BBK16 TaxID=2699888 RepID=UPI0038D30B8C
MVNPFGVKIRQGVGVKMEVLDFEAIIFVQQGFEALSLKKQFTEKLKCMWDNALRAG